MHADFCQQLGILKVKRSDWFVLHINFLDIC